MPELASRRILVTGGLGFIGSEVIRLCRERGLDAVAVAQNGAEGELDGVVVADLADRAAVEALIEGFDIVVHLAARAGGIMFQEETEADTFAVNRRMTDNVLHASRRNGVERVFLASSAAIYRSRKAAFSEDSPKLSIEDHPSQYAWSKITDEVAARWLSDLEVVIGRFGNVFGPGAPVGTSSSTVVHALIHRALRLSPGSDFEVWGDGSVVRSFVYVHDVARAILTIVEAAAPGAAINVDTGEAITIAQLAELIRDTVDPSLRLHFDASKPAGVPFRVQDPSALAELGFVPETGLVEGIERTVAWFRTFASSP